MVTGDASDVEILAGMVAAPAKAWDKLWLVADALPSGERRVPVANPGEGKPRIYPFYEDAAEELQRVVYDAGLVPEFSWTAWSGFFRYQEGHEDLAAAPVTEAARVMTTIIREERFGEGMVTQALENGTMTAVLDRIRHWYYSERCDGLAEVAAVVAELASDPMFAASQSSKELFHSNMLAWYLQRWPQARSELARAWNLPLDHPDDQVVIGREEHHLDLVMKAAGRLVLVVENKVFALPDETQLARYTAAIRQEMPGDPA